MAMEFTKEEFSLLYGGSREATVIRRSGEVIYQNGAVTSLLGELPLSMLLHELREESRNDYIESVSLYGRSFVVTAKPLGELQLLRIHSGEVKELLSPSLVAELKDLLFSQQLTTKRLLDAIDEEESDLYGSAVRRSLFGLQNYAERLADLSQIAAGGLVIMPELIDLTQLYRDTILALELVLPEKYPLPTLMAEESCFVNADAKRMEELLLYLLSNNLRHGKSEGSIKVRLRREKKSVRLSVEDNGSGMDSDTVARLFDPEAKGVLNGRMELGLTLAKGIAQAHGGSLLIESRKGEGTRVLVSLPAAEITDLPVQESIPPEGIQLIQRILVDVLDLGAYREVFDD